MFFQVIDGCHIENESIIKLKDVFKDDVMSIQKMPRFHLVLLLSVFECFVSVMRYHSNIVFYSNFFNQHKFILVSGCYNFTCCLTNFLRILVCGIHRMVIGSL